MLLFLQRAARRLHLQLTVTVQYSISRSIDLTGNPPVVFFWFS